MNLVPCPCVYFVSLSTFPFGVRSNIEGRFSLYFLSVSFRALSSRMASHTKKHDFPNRHKLYSQGSGKELFLETVARKVRTDYFLCFQTNKKQNETNTNKRRTANNKQKHDICLFGLFFVWVRCAYPGKQKYTSP